MQTMALWSTALEALQALGRHYGPEMDRAAAELNLSEWYGWLLPALVFEPEPISAAHLRMRSPYTSPRLCNERLSTAAMQGFLARVAGTEHDYRLTGLGMDAAERVIAVAYARMSELQPLPPTDLEQLAGLLNRVVMACLGAAEPPGKWCIFHSRRTDPGEEASVLVRIDQYMSDLAAYRDDAHLASWQPHQIEGHMWDAFTCLWRGEAKKLVELVQKMEHRGYLLDEYQQALEELTRRGWINEEAGEYHLSPPGEDVRQAAEDATDRYFYAPWSCLSRAEMEAMHDLFVRLRDALAAVA